jgi:hypothetical protein
LRNVSTSAGLRLGLDCQRAPPSRPSCGRPCHVVAGRASDCRAVTRTRTRSAPSERPRTRLQRGSADLRRPSALWPRRGRRTPGGARPVRGAASSGELATRRRRRCAPVLDAVPGPASRVLAGGGARAAGRRLGRAAVTGRPAPGRPGPRGFGGRVHWHGASRQCHRRPSTHGAPPVRRPCGRRPIQRSPPHPLRTAAGGRPARARGDSGDPLPDRRRLLASCSGRAPSPLERDGFAGGGRQEGAILVESLRKAIQVQHQLHFAV